MRNPVNIIWLCFIPCPGSALAGHPHSLKVASGSDNIIIAHAATRCHCLSRRYKRRSIAHRPHNPGLASLREACFAWEAPVVLSLRARRSAICHFSVRGATCAKSARAFRVPADLPENTGLACARLCRIVCKLPPPVFPGSTAHKRRERALMVAFRVTAACVSQGASGVNSLTRSTRPSFIGLRKDRGKRSLKRPCGRTKIVAPPHRAPPCQPRLPHR